MLHRLLYNLRMVFSSSVFLFAFLPVFLALYFVMPWRGARNVWLLAASLVFYAWGEPVYVWLMVVAIAVNWLFGLAIGKARASGEIRSGGGWLASCNYIASCCNRVRLSGHWILQV